MEEWWISNGVGGRKKGFLEDLIKVYIYILPYVTEFLWDGKVILLLVLIY